MIRFECPGCDAEIEVPDNKAGAKATCGECGERIEIPMPGKKKTSPLAAGRPAVKSTAPKQRAADVDDDEPEEKTSRPSSKRSRPDEDEEDDRPKKKSARAGSKRRRGQDDEDGSNSSKKKLLLIGGGVLAAAAVGIVVFIMMQPGNKGNDANKQTTENKQPITPSKPAPPVVPVNNEEAKVEEVVKKGPVVTKGAPTKNDIYRHVLASTVWIYNITDPATGAGGMGTGTVVDKKHKLVLTNVHVVDHTRILLTMFPAHEGSKLVVEKDRYMKKIQARSIDAIQATVLATAATKDLALIQLDKIPEGVLPLAVSDKSASPGDEILSVGNPGVSDSLWVATTGTVRQVGHKKYKSGGHGTVYDLDMEVVETQSPVNPGDSGGPMVNTNGGPVGVTQGYNPGGNLASVFIDVSEVRTFIENTCKANNLTWQRSDRKVEGLAQGNVPELVKALESSDVNVRREAAQGLAEMGRNAVVAVGALVKLLKDTDSLCRSLALTALNKIGAPDRSAVTMLKDALKDPVVAVRVYAAEALGKIGPDARMAGPDLIGLLKDAEADVRQHAARSLGRIDFDEKETLVAALTPLLKDSNKAVRVAAGETLTMGKSLGTADIAKLLKHRDTEVRVCAAHGLGKLGLNAKSALPDLIDAFKNSSDDKEARRAIIEVLANFGAQAKTAMEVFKEAMNDGDLQPVASLALSKMGRDAKPALKELNDGLASPNQDTKKNCLVALGNIGPDAKEAVPALTLMLQQKESSLRMDVLTALGGIGPGAADAIPDLIQILRETTREAKSIKADSKQIEIQVEETYNKDLHNKVTDVLGKIGKEAVKPLSNSLTDSHKFVRVGVVVALGKIGWDARTQAKNLLFLRDRDPAPEVRSAARLAYNQVTTKPKSTPMPMKTPPKKKAA